MWTHKLCLESQVTCSDFLHELSGAVTAVHQQMCPVGEIFSRVHSEQMSLYTLFSAQPQAERQLRVMQRWTLTRSRMNKSENHKQILKPQVQVKRGLIDQWLYLVVIKG